MFELWCPLLPCSHALCLPCCTFFSPFLCTFISSNPLKKATQVLLHLHQQPQSLPLSLSPTHYLLGNSPHGDSIEPTNPGHPWEEVMPYFLRVEKWGDQIESGRWEMQWREVTLKKRGENRKRVSIDIEHNVADIERKTATQGYPSVAWSDMF